MSNIAPKKERQAWKPYCSAPHAVHCWGCPGTVLGINGGDCDCGAEEAQWIIDAFWKESGLGMKIQNAIAERVKPHEYVYHGHSK